MTIPHARRARTVLARTVAAAAALVLGACASRPIVGRPPIPPGVDEAHLHFADAVVGKGDLAPDFTLPTADGEGTITLSSLRGRPVVLVFGSHTCNLFARDIPAVRKLWEETHEHAEFLLVYVREAHACDEWEMEDNHARGLIVTQPKSTEERAAAAQACVADFRLEMPTVVDRVDDWALRTYGGWPDRLYVIDAEGRITFQSGVGPFGFKPDLVREHLRRAYGF